MPTGLGVLELLIARTDPHGGRCALLPYYRSKATAFSSVTGLAPWQDAQGFSSSSGRGQCMIVVRECPIDSMWLAGDEKYSGMTACRCMAYLPGAGRGIISQLVQSPAQHSSCALG